MVSATLDRSGKIGPFLIFKREQGKRSRRKGEHCPLNSLKAGIKKEKLLSHLVTGS